jgi:transcriptional regulator with XRE-family HTH domain
MSPEQSRAARGWLDWTQKDLADRAKVGLSTIKDFEAGTRTPIANNLTAIRRALEEEGIELLFSPDGGPTGIAVLPAQRLNKGRPPAEGTRRRPGRRAAIASPKRRSG